MKIPYSVEYILSPDIEKNVRSFKNAMLGYEQMKGSRKSTDTHVTKLQPTRNKDTTDSKGAF